MECVQLTSITTGFAGNLLGEAHSYAAQDVMKPNLVYLRPLKLAYVRAVGPYAQSSVEAWSRLFSWLSDNGLHTFPGCGYGLVLDNHLMTDGATCRYDACIELNAAIESRAEGVLQSRKLPAGAYIRERHVGCYDALRERTLAVRERAVQKGELPVDTRRPLVQIFLDDPRREQADNLRSDLCIPVIAHPILGSAEGSLN